MPHLARPVGRCRSGVPTKRILPNQTPGSCSLARPREKGWKHHPLGCFPSVHGRTLPSERDLAKWETYSYLKHFLLVIFPLLCVTFGHSLFFRGPPRVGCPPELDMHVRSCHHPHVLPIVRMAWPQGWLTDKMGRTVRDGLFCVHACTRPARTAHL